jgi:hypothetical protein
MRQQTMVEVNEMIARIVTQVVATSFITNKSTSYDKHDLDFIVLYSYMHRKLVTTW